MDAAIEAVLLRAAWQRYRVHVLRNVLARAPKGNSELVAATIGTAFPSPTPNTSAPSST